MSIALCSNRILKVAKDFPLLQTAKLSALLHDSPLFIFLFIAPEYSLLCYIKIFTTYFCMCVCFIHV